jgi:hypothetical protein
VVILPAHLVATPVLERLTAGLGGARSGGRGGELKGVILGIGATAAWVDLDGFVVAITTREVPLLPNAITLAAGSGALASAGAGSGGTARLGPCRLTLGSLQVTWDPGAPPSWDPTVPVPEGVTLPAVEARGAALLRALGSEGAEQAEEGEGAGGAEEAGGAMGAVDNQENQFPRSATLPHRGPEQPPGAEAHARGRDPARDPVQDLAWDPARDPAEDLLRTLTRIGLATANDPEGAAGLAVLFRAVRERDPELADAGVRVLLGRGPGLTPEGDDLLAAVAGTLAVLGPAVYSPAPSRELPPPDRFWSKVPPEPPGDPTGGAPPPEPPGDPTGGARPTERPSDPVLAVLTSIPGRTTALSATLLALAATRRLPEPAGRLLDFSPAGEEAWPAALARLERLGHGSGRAYAAGIAVTASLLGAAAPPE